jgi:rhamnulokinase
VADAVFAAIDLGAETGRVLRGRVAKASLVLDETARFANRPVRLPDGLRWDLVHLFDHALRGIARAAADGPLTSVGVDAWGVDYALLDERGAMLGLPFHHRDRRIDGMVECAARRLAPEELYAATGIQRLPINTVYQLLADERSGALARAQRIALVPDLFGLWLTGVLRNEVTAASTSGLLAAGERRWAHAAIAALGLPAQPFDDDLLVEPGTRLGTVLSSHADAYALRDELPVVAVAGHDTASAFAAAPVDSPATSAILSSGTWSLLGLELDEPVLDGVARAANLTNERGVDGTTRLLKNVMGLWLLQECRRAWAQQGMPRDYDTLARMAAAEHGDVALFDPDDPELLMPGPMPARIMAACERAGQRAPATPAAIVRSILVSLACKYRCVLESLEHASGRVVDRIHVIGGGVRNELLCQLTASICERTVLAGPVEAAARGNVLVQARAAGIVASRADGRALVAASQPPVVYHPHASRDLVHILRRFLDLVSPPAPTSAR